MNYFDFYKLVLETIEENNPNDGMQLQSQLNRVPQIVESIKNEQDGILLGKQFQEVLDNLITDGLVKGKIIVTKSGNLYMLKGLSTTGHQYLKNLKDSNFLNKVKSVLKEEGIPLTPSTITRAIAKLIW